MARNYKKLEIYHLAHEFILGVYRETENFPESENSNITSQIRRAAVSIALNIAEGSTRNSKKAFLQFLTYSFGSGKETEVLLSLSKDLGFLKEKNFVMLSEQLDQVMAKLFLFMRNLESEIPGSKYGFFQKWERKG